MSSSSNIEYSFPTKAACVFGGGLTSGWPAERLKLIGGLDCWEAAAVWADKFEVGSCRLEDFEDDWEREIVEKDDLPLCVLDQPNWYALCWWCCDLAVLLLPSLVLFEVWGGGLLGLSRSSASIELDGEENEEVDWGNLEDDAVRGGSQSSSLECASWEARSRVPKCSCFAFLSSDSEPLGSDNLRLPGVPLDFFLSNIPTRINSGRVTQRRDWENSYSSWRHGLVWCQMESWMRCTTIPCIVADERLVPVSRLRPTKAIEYSWFTNYKQYTRETWQGSCKVTVCFLLVSWLLRRNVQLSLVCDDACCASWPFTSHCWTLLSAIISFKSRNVTGVERW